MVNSLTVTVTGDVAQAACAIVIAAVLSGLYRHYRRGYFLHWTWSWWVLSVSLLCAAGALASGAVGTFDGRPAMIARLVSLVAAAVQAAWLVAGTFELVRGRPVARGRLRAALGLLAILGAGAFAFSLSLQPLSRPVVESLVRTVFAALAFLVAGVGVFRARSLGRSMGRTVVGASFFAYAAAQIYDATLLVSGAFGAYAASSSLAEILAPVLQTLMGLGMVTWLLEEERSRAIDATALAAHRAQHDPLTELANRTLFCDHLAAAISKSKEAKTEVAVFLLDLDRFKDINDSLGHGRGDELLRLVTGRLRASLRPGDTVARLGGDEFTVLVPKLSGDRDLVRIADKVLNAIRRPYTLDGREVVVTASLGASRYPHDGTEPDDLLKKADVAMYQVKAQGRDGYQLYAASMDANAVDRLALENDLRKALIQGELILHYQPVLAAVSGDIVSVEALLRWRHPSRGLLPPSEFLWLAETSGMSNALDLWVLRTACQEVRSWQRVPHGSGLRVAVNLSARSFQRSDLVERVKDVLWETGLPSSCLELEITETIAMHNAEASLRILRELKELGVRIAIDDFGTGYSSLSYLRTFPVDTLKMDASFVRSLHADRASSEIAAAVIALAHSLGMRVIAEGVEQEQQWKTLRSHGCDELQGYLFSAARPADECRELVAAPPGSLFPDASAEGEAARRVL
jgi:diguanylate cyclase (GGDEF)-like protein